MKKGRIRSAIRKSFQEYYDKGLTSTGDRVMKKVLKDIDKVYEKYHKR